MKNEDKALFTRVTFVFLLAFGAGVAGVVLTGLPPWTIVVFFAGLTIALVIGVPIGIWLGRLDASRKKTN